MGKKILVYWFIASLMVVSCVNSISSSDNKKPGVTGSQQQSKPPLNYSFGTRWEIENQTLPNDNGFSLIVFALKLTSHNTIIINSVSGSEANELSQTATTIQMRDNVSDIKLISKYSLVSVEKIAFFVMKFEARRIGSSELSLVIGSNDNNIYYYNKSVAKLVEPPEDPSVFNVRTYLVGTTQIFEQDAYRISFEGWIPPPSSAASPALDIPKGTTITDNVTLRLENILNGKVSYLYIQLLSNGDTRGELIPNQ